VVAAFLVSTLTGDGLTGTLGATAEEPVAVAEVAVLAVVMGWLPVKVTELLVLVSATLGGFVLALAVVVGLAAVEPEAAVGLAA
jgi:hypothetical protein